MSPDLAPSFESHSVLHLPMGLLLAWHGMAWHLAPPLARKVGFSGFLPGSLTLTLKPTCTRPHLTLVLALGSTLHAPAQSCPAQFLPFPPVRK